MSCASTPLNDGAVAPAQARPRKRRPKKAPPPKPQRTALPLVDVRTLVAVSVPSPWHVLFALGSFRVLCLPLSERLLWAEHVALHVAAGPEDARADALLAHAGVEVSEHPLRPVRQAVVAVLRVERPRFFTPATPWFHGAELHVKDAFPLHAIPCEVDRPGLACWEPGDELRHEVRRAFKAALAARAHLEAEGREEALHARRVGMMEAELDGLLDARVAEARAMSTPQLAKPLAQVVVTSVDPAVGTFTVQLAAPALDPLAELQRRYEASQQRTRALEAKYARYPRSVVATCPVTGLKGYLCPECEEWFNWCPGVQAHACGTKP